MSKSSQEFLRLQERGIIPTEPEDYYDNFNFNAIYNRKGCAAPAADGDSAAAAGTDAGVGLVPDTHEPSGQGGDQLHPSAGDTVHQGKPGHAVLGEEGREGGADIQGGVSQ